MCGNPTENNGNNPTTVGSASPALGALSDVLGFVGQDRANRAGRSATWQNFFDRQSALDTQRSELDAADAERTVDEAILSAQEGGRIAVVSGEFLGAAAQARLKNAAAQEASRAEAIADLNSQNQRRQLGREKRGAAIERDSALAKYAKPSKVALGIRLVGRGVDAANQVASAKKG